jgi:hypothetical protein
MQFPLPYPLFATEMKDRLAGFALGESETRLENLAIDLPPLVVFLTTVPPC